MIRIGVDFGGTKIEAAALDAEGRFQARVRAASPNAYDDSLAAVRDLIAEAERQAGVTGASVGIGIPGSPNPVSGLIRNANTTRLNGKPLQADFERVLGRPVRLANDANCLALSEAVDGAGSAAGVVFAAILGTGCGAGVTVDGRLVEGFNGIAGEWGHTPLPWPRADEYPGPMCWCGHQGCLELWVSGTGLGRSWRADADGQAVVAAARDGEASARAALDAYIERLGRALAVICNILDPDVIVLGGGMSNVDEIYAPLPATIAPHVFSDAFETPIRKARHGDSSGVRGAAWLWPLPS